VLGEGAYRKSSIKKKWRPKGPKNIKLVISLHTCEDMKQQ
jgi:hypothetical protein